MKKPSAVLKNIPFVLLFLSASILFASCLKNDNNDGTQQSTAGLMALNLAPDQNVVGFSMSNNLLTHAPLSYTNYTGGYLGVFPGSGGIDAFDFNSGATLASSNSLNFEIGKYYSVFLVGDSGHYASILTKDDYDSLPAVSGTAYVRYINAVTDSVNSATVKISAGGTDVFNDAAPFKTVSSFKAVAAGSVDVSTGYEAGAPVTRSITLEANKAYTVLLIGQRNATDPNKQVQIKFIANVSIQ